MAIGTTEEVAELKAIIHLNLLRTDTNRAHSGERTVVLLRRVLAVQVENSVFPTSVNYFKKNASYSKRSVNFARWNVA